MSAALLTPSQLAAIQGFGVLGMTSTVEIFPDIYDTGLDAGDDPYGSTLEYGVTPASTVKGWLVSTLATLREEGTGFVASTTTYHLRLPIGTDIHVGWLVKISDEPYLVQDIGPEDTWPDWLACTLKRKE